MNNALFPESASQNPPPMGSTSVRRLWLGAIGSAVLGVALLLLAMQRYKREVSGGEPVPVLFALRDLPMGGRIDAEMLGSKTIPSAYVEQRHIRTAEASKLHGARVSAGLHAGETILWSDLANAGADRRDLSRLVPHDHRAVGLSADANASLGGLVRPGDRVDVWLTANRFGQETTTLLMQNVMVLASGGYLGSTSGASTAASAAASSGASTGASELPSNALTLSVTVPQAHTLAHAKSQGRLTVALRNPADITLAADPGTPTTSAPMQPAPSNKGKEIEHVR